MAVRYLIDTDICIYLRQKQPPAAWARFERIEPGEGAISVITYGELAYGAYKSSDPKKRLAWLERLTGLLPVLPLPDRTGDAYGRIRSYLEAAGEVVGAHDLWIAAHALASGLVLVTNNEREYRRVKDLKIENWTK